MKKILVPIDFSDCSINALEYAIVIAKKLNFSITVFHSFYFSMPPEYDAISSYINITIEEEQKNNENQIKALLKKYENEQYEDDSQKLQMDSIVKLGLITEDITALAVEHHFDMIVMGTKGATGIDKLLFGSVTANIIGENNIKCPVLAVPKEAKYRGVSHILYGMDYEEDDLPVIDDLLEFADAFEARITCLHVNTDYDTMSADRLEKEILEDTYWFTPYSKIKFELMRSESTQAGLETYVKENGIDLVAVMPRKRSFLESLFHKSISKDVATYAGVPVLVIKK
jgi:nucleotide-binding universal stress UspA family protein